MIFWVERVGKLEYAHERLLNRVDITQLVEFNYIHVSNTVRKFQEDRVSDVRLLVKRCLTQVMGNLST